jgi:hypothetical protein
MFEFWPITLPQPGFRRAALRTCGGFSAARPLGSRSRAVHGLEEGRRQSRTPQRVGYLSATLSVDGCNSPTMMAAGRRSGPGRPHLPRRCLSNLHAPEPAPARIQRDSSYINSHPYWIGCASALASNVRCARNEGGISAVAAVTARWPSAPVTTGASRQLISHSLPLSVNHPG